jgi:hypothetical protein
MGEEEEGVGLGWVKKIENQKIEENQKTKRKGASPKETQTARKHNQLQRHQNRTNAPSLHR